MIRFPRPVTDQNFGFARGPRIADLMTSDHQRFVESSRAAERAGDAAAALEFHQGIPMFSWGAHRVALAQLVPLADEMTPWMWARWAAYQCTRAEEMDHGVGPRQRAALQYVVDTMYGDLLDRALRDGEDWMPVVARLAGESWLVHQWCTYELGALASFLDELATDRLLAESGLARRWTSARMGGYRLVDCGDDRLVVRDLATGEDLQLLDLGARLHAGAGGCVVGRLVASGTDPALMFDTRPVAVDERTALEVARGPRGGWISTVRQAIEARRVDRSVFESEDRELVTDVHSLVLVEYATPPQALAATLDQLARGRDEVGRAAYKILRRVAEGTLPEDAPPPIIAAAVLQPHAYAEAQRGLALSCSSHVWRSWADRLPEPARGRFLQLAEATPTA